MIPDIMALARDVDRLFRARQDGRQMPVGEQVRTGRGSYFLEPCPDEWRALMIRQDDGEIRREAGRFINGRRRLWDGQDRTMRSLRHVALLALTEHDHFVQCLAKVRDHNHADYPDPPPRIQRSRDRRQAKMVADVARTARYLQVLDARLTEWREAEAVRAAIEARDREIAEQDALAAAAQEPIPQEDEDAILAMA